MIIPDKFKLSAKVLHKAGTPMDFKNPNLNLTLAKRMVEFMLANGGIGLAAPQIGISKRLFVMKIDEVAYHCFNPEITWSSEERVPCQEGCLSYPDEFIEIIRPKDIKVKFQDHAGSWHEHEFTGLHSVCFQHEYDHLDGIVMYDRKLNDQQQ
jgi:peptide deformylase